LVVDDKWDMAICSYCKGMLVLRFSVLGTKFYWDDGKVGAWAVFDTAIVFITSADLYIMAYISGGSGDNSATFMRLLRLAKATNRS